MILVSKAAERAHHNDGGHDICRTLLRTCAEGGSPATGFQSLLAIQDEIIMPGVSRATLLPDQVEVISAVLEGEVEFGECPGTRTLVPTGKVYHASSGLSRALHQSNPSQTEASHVLHFWIAAPAPVLPRSGGRQLPLTTHGPLQLIASQDGRTGSLALSQDVNLWHARLAPGERLHQVTCPTRHLWVHLAEGQVSLQGQNLMAGDGAAIRNETSLRIQVRRHSRIFLFDLGDVESICPKTQGSQRPV